MYWHLREFCCIHHWVAVWRNSILTPQMQLKKWLSPILTPQMQLKKWLSQKTLFIKAASLTRSLGKPSVTPTQAKKLVTEGFDYQSLSLLHRTSRTMDDFHEGLKKRGVRSKPLGEKLFKALSSRWVCFPCCSPPSPFVVTVFYLFFSKPALLRATQRKILLTAKCAYSLIARNGGAVME